MKFKVGDIVKAVNNDYAVTSLDNGWVGIVTKVCKDYFTAKTLYCDIYRFTTYNELEYKHFKLLDKPLEEVAYNSILKFTSYAEELFKKYNINIQITPKPQILDEVEKRYLSNIIRPFRDRILCIVKSKAIDCEYEYIEISVKSIYGGVTDIEFPLFKANTMYKGMIPNKCYTLEELGL